MASTHAPHSYYSFPTQAITVPQKPGEVYPTQQYPGLSTSPPEAQDSATESSGPVFDPSTASYAASTSDYEGSSSGLSSVDLLELINDRLQSSYNPLPLDRTVAAQAQT